MGAPTVVPGAETLFGLQVSVPLIPEFVGWPHGALTSATLDVTVREFDGEAENRELDLPLGQYRLFCRTTEDSDAQFRRSPNAAVEDLRQNSRCY